MLRPTSNAVKEIAFSDDELKELELARKREIVFDEDCPETTMEKELRFRRVNSTRRIPE